jgi:hypothetical protein
VGTQEQAPQMTVDAKRPVGPALMRKHTKALPVSLVTLVIVALILFIVLVLVHGRGGDKITLPPVGTAAAVSESQLKALANQAAGPIYWAGPRSGTYELTRTTDGRTYVRYLPDPDKVGDRGANYLTIGTYPTTQAFRSLKRAAARSGGVSAAIDDGGLMVFNEDNPKSVYFGYPGTKYQVEVYDPSPQQARALVLGGKVTPIK